MPDPTPPAGTNNALPLLDYTLHTQPHPLYIDELATIDIVISNGQPYRVDCRQIVVLIPTGPHAHHLTEAITLTYDIIGYFRDKEEKDRYAWISSAKTKKAIVVVSGTATPGKEKVGVRLIDTHSVTIRITNVPLNKQVGTALLTITEKATILGGSPQVAHTTLSLPKHHHAPPDLDAISLWAESPTSSSEKTNGAPTTQDGFILRWNGPNSIDYAIQQGREKPVPIPPGQTSLPWDPLTKDTTFTLINAASNTPLATTTVTVPHPHLTTLALTKNLTTTSLTTPQLHITDTLSTASLADPNATTHHATVITANDNPTTVRPATLPEILGRIFAATLTNKTTRKLNIALEFEGDDIDGKIGKIDLKPSQFVDTDKDIVWKQELKGKTVKNSLTCTTINTPKDDRFTLSWTVNGALNTLHLTCTTEAEFTITDTNTTTKKTLKTQPGSPGELESKEGFMAGYDVNITIEAKMKIAYKLTLNEIKFTKIDDGIAQDELEVYGTVKIHDKTVWERARNNYIGKRVGDNVLDHPVNSGRCDPTGETITITADLWDKDNSGDEKIFDHNDTVTWDIASNQLGNNNGHVSGDSGEANITYHVDRDW